ncbi:hypothetical protein C0J08_15640 [Marinomonas sp. CT5]|uniref:hypothetical protein n=1 Tax=Marinomonas sp. CT5 TaxID=2066133 RepID=UPI0017B12D0C|nr:hypothetical protein [Marinomonas sp. CT5]NVK73604.1 hypothetical protein [Oceanospirillaceae bacterium]QUX96741.1 hypothetical protein C0J08_15640 [Marinomonas sp. CT5]
MFGIKRMHQQRDRLYRKTQRLEKQAKASRERAIDHALEKATSPEGLIASFVLGASTQLDITRKARKNILNGATKEVMSFLISQLSAYWNAGMQNQSEPEQPKDPQTPSDTNEDVPESGVVKTDQDIDDVFPSKENS